MRQSYGKLGPPLDAHHRFSHLFYCNRSVACKLTQSIVLSISNWLIIWKLYWKSFKKRYNKNKYHHSSESGSYRVIRKKLLKKHKNGNDKRLFDRIICLIFSQIQRHQALTNICTKPRSNQTYGVGSKLQVFYVVLIIIIIISQKNSHEPRESLNYSLLLNSKRYYTF